MEFFINNSAVCAIEATYSKSMSQLGACVKATFPRADNERNVNASLGDRVEVKNNGVSYFFGMITEVTTTDTKLSITAYDCCYYLNKTKILIQFDGISVGDALSELWKQCSITCRHMPSMIHQVNSIHYAQTPADIAKALISAEEENNGGEYYLTSESFNSVEIYRVGELACSASLTAIMAPTKSQTLEGVKNRVSIIVSDGDGYSEIETAGDGTSILKYGVLQEYINVSSDASAAVGIAQNRLNQLKLILAQGNITVAGNWALTAVGKRINVNEPISGLCGTYVITSVSHKLGDDFQTTLGLREHYSTSTFKTDVATAKPATISAISRSRASSYAEYRRING